MTEAIAHDLTYLTRAATHPCCGGLLAADRTTWLRSTRHCASPACQRCLWADAVAAVLVFVVPTASGEWRRKPRASSPDRRGQRRSAAGDPSRSVHRGVQPAGRRLARSQTPLRRRPTAMARRPRLTGRREAGALNPVVVGLRTPRTWGLSRTSDILHAVACHAGACGGLSTVTVWCRRPGLSTRPRSIGRVRWSRRADAAATLACARRDGTASTSSPWQLWPSNSGARLHTARVQQYLT